MSKKKRSVRFKLAAKKNYTFDVDEAMSNIAYQYTQIAQRLTPLIRAQKMSPIEALVLISTYTDATIAGATKEHTMTEKEIIGTTNLLIRFWKQGLFVPPSDYPYTLEETLTLLDESEDGSESDQ